MDCPRCGERLDRYQYGDREAASCPDCGWTGISADHRGDGREPESWNDALERYHEGERRELDPEKLAAVAAAMRGESDD